MTAGKEMETTNHLPPPPVPPDADLRDFDFTPIYRARLFGSAFHARSSDAEWRAGVTLWLKCQDQTPAGSLPDDDIELCRLAELGRDTKTWKKLRTGAMRGWYKANDGRLYNKVVAEVVNEQWMGRLTKRWNAHCSAIRKANQRQKTDNPTPSLDAWLETIPASWKVPTANTTPQLSHAPTPNVTRDNEEVSHVTIPNVTLPSRENTQQVERDRDRDRDREILRDDADDRERIAKKVLTSIDAWDDPNLRLHGGRIGSWLAAGADVDLDIIPTLQAVLLKARQSSGNERWFPSSMNYFDKAIAEAVTRRTKPMPSGGTHDGTIPPRNNPISRQRPSDHERRSAIADVFPDVMADDGRSAGVDDRSDPIFDPVG